jgi:hypothetical protein
MSNVLTSRELKKLAKLGKDIMACLSCDINDSGVPCRTDRFEAISLMKKYLEIHDYEIRESVQDVCNLEKAYNILMDYFNYIPEDERQEVSNRLEKLGL